jgi:hypothetical protein
MSPEELLLGYPTIRDAVALFEETCGDDVPHLRRRVEGGATVEQLVRWFVNITDATVAEDDPPNAPELLRAREQFLSPEFKEYLAARLGLV